MTLEHVLAQLASARAQFTGFPIRSLAVFGSVARNEAASGSDVDVLVEFSMPVGLLDFVRLRRRLEEILGAKVDLTTPSALRAEWRDEILRESVRAA